MNLSLHAVPNDTMAGVGRQLRSGRLSCRDLVDRCLAQIDKYEADVRAWVSVDREVARRVADERDAELQAGRDRGPLHGIPIGIKDIIDVAGHVTAAGSERRAGQTPAVADATLVHRLREGGAIILGKTVTTQFASFDPPPTCNPWNLDRTPGGSSSGSAAAVAAGMCLGAVGSQTGGSITRPAAFCGVAGCKPSYGRVSAAGVVPLAPRLDHPGPIARTVADLAVMLAAIAGPDPCDPLTLTDRPPVRFDALRLPSHPPRLGRLRGLFEARASSDMNARLEDTLRMWSDAGAEIVDIELPASFDAVLPNHRTIMAVEAAAFHEQAFASHPDDYRPAIRSLIEEGRSTSATVYARSIQHQMRLTREMRGCFENVAALVCPAALGPAPETTTTGDPAFNSPWSHTGLPTVSFPIALAADGLPLAVQLVGPPWGEAGLFETALWCEAMTRR